MNFLDLQNIDSALLNLFDNKKVMITSAVEGAKLHIASRLHGIYVTLDRLQASKVASELSGYGLDVITLFSRDDILLYRKNYSKEFDRLRGYTLAKIARGAFDILVITAEELLSRVTDFNLIRNYTLKFNKEKSYNLLKLAEDLTRLGYTRQEEVFEEGDFSIRGDIVDIWATCEKNPFRLDFFDDELDNIKVFDFSNGKKIEERDEIFISPTSDLICSKSALKECFDVSKITRGRVNSIFEELKGGLHEGVLNGKYSYLTPLLDTQSLLDEDFTFIFDEPKLISEKISLYAKEFLSRFTSLKTSGEIMPRHINSKSTEEMVRDKISKSRIVGLTSLNLTNPLFKAEKTFDLSSKAVTKYCYDYPALIADLKNYCISGFKVVLCSRNKERAKAILDSLLAEGILPNFDTEPISGKVTVLPISIEQGFLYPKFKLIVIGAIELIGKRRSLSASVKTKNFTPPKEGDYVVHAIHGVGVCEGTAVFNVGEFQKEYLSIRYQGGDHLYVAIDQMDMVTKFIGEENPPLNKLGGKDFKREKDKVKKSVRQIAINLVNLYAEREKTKGHSYGIDTVEQHQFEDNFPYEETVDQLEAIKTIKDEMEKGKIIDRLICGDVGFGKTEVAFRAMFKTVMEGKQAALLAPTTILCKQHYDNLLERLKGFDLNVKLLTRFQTMAERKEIIDGLKSGDVQMVIASHRLLSKDIEFFDLGLLVLDEEQRFGVEHKEKLKEKNPLINVLTLSATPIPRTLNMSLSGVRDISLLETPPLGRLPVETYVVEQSDSLIVDAINREVLRGGQVFVLYNRVESIADYKDKLCSLLNGSCRIRYAHGQMSPKQLEDTVEAFYEKQFDVLVSTTIIENGIDLPDANTLIVIDSQNFGLSQLYQLRGRVGRRGALAKAYFTIPQSRSISEDAQKRFDALLDNTEIGSGFKISLADLSIRGAGNILGAEQHGHIERVGYEMYLEILEDAIREIKTGISEDTGENIEFKIDATTYISPDYVSSRDKIKMYKRIATVSSIKERDDFLLDIEANYGSPEKGLYNLLNIALIKNLVKGLGVKSVVVNRNGAGVNFLGDEVFKSSRVIEAVSTNRDDAILTSTIPPSLVFNVAGLSPEQKLDKIAKFFALD